MKRALVNGGGGFIGAILMKRPRREGIWIRAVDLKCNEFGDTPADEFIIADLRDPAVVRDAVEGVDEVYQHAADMGGAGYIFTGQPMRS